MSRRRPPAVLVASTAALLLTGGAIWVSPAPSSREPRPSDLQLALAAEQTRAEDLSAQVDALEAQLARPRGLVEDVVQQARADDLRGQVDDLEVELAAAQRRAGVLEAQRGRADDLKVQLDTAVASRSSVKADLEAQLAAERGRANDLAAQVGALSSGLSRPRRAAAGLARGQAAPQHPDGPDSPAEPPPPRGPGDPDPPAGPPPVVLTKAQVVASRDLFGLYTRESPFFNREYEGLEAAVGHDANVAGYFQSWTTPFDSAVVQRTWRRGEIPLLTWESQVQVGQTTSEQPDYSNAQILSGRYDDYIRQYARDITANGQTIILRFDHEMNGTWYPWGEGLRWDAATQRRDVPTNGNAPDSYSAMWRHVHTIFAQEGANDHVVWLWAPNRVDALPPSARSLDVMRRIYPGDGYVDMVGMSGYLRSNYDPDASYQDVYGATLGQITTVAPGKPVLLAEVGAAESVGTKPRYVRALFDGAGADPRIAGVVWFSLEVGSDDWRVDSSPESVAAFREALDGSRFGKASP